MLLLHADACTYAIWGITKLLIVVAWYTTCFLNNRFFEWYFTYRNEMDC